MMKKIVLTLIVATVAALSGSAENYGINVGGVEVSSDNCTNVIGKDIKSGVVTYSKSTNTLTLSYVKISRTSSGDYAVHNRGCANLKIVFKGECDLWSSSAHCIKLDKSTTIEVSSGALVDAYSGSKNALNMGNVELTFTGSGTIHFENSQGGDAAIKGSDIATINFNGARIVAKSKDNNAFQKVILCFKSGADLRVYNNATKQLFDNCVFYGLEDLDDAEGEPVILQPIGAYAPTTRGTLYTSLGSPVINSDAYISDQYVALLNSYYFPDANFRSALTSSAYNPSYYDLFSKKYLTKSNVESITTMPMLAGCNISNLKGIEYLTYLKSIDCHSNKITSLDVTKLTKLETLYCNNNQLTSLKVPNSVKALYCEQNKLTSFTLPTSLVTLSCGNNQLTSLTFPQNVETVSCPYNKFTKLNMASLSKLKQVNASYNTSLTEFDSHSSPLTELNINGCTSLKTLNCYGNKLTTINVKGLGTLENLNVGSNPNMTTLDCSNNKLTQLYIKNTPLTSLNCSNNLLTDVDWNGVIETVNCSNNKFESFGIFGTPSLKTLILDNNPLLTAIRCDDNSLTTLSFSNCPSLTSLICDNNALTSLSLSNCPSLTYLKCGLNPFTNQNLNLSGCPKLKTLEAWDNNLTSITGIPNTIETLGLSGNKFTTFNLTSKPALKLLSLSENKNLTSVEVQNNALETLYVELCPALTYLRCSNNKLTELSLFQCLAIKTLNIVMNKIKGDNMWRLINTLPSIPESEELGKIYVLFSTSEGNEITDAQIKSLREKRWLPYQDKNGQWKEMGGGLLGDVNGDGEVDIQDVTALITYILGTTPPNFVLENANVSQDPTGTIDVQDVTALINMILN